MNTSNFVPLEGYSSVSDQEMSKRAHDFFQLMKLRRTIRDFSAEPVSRDVIEQAILTAGRAPSGANKQPWHFAAISSVDMKHKIRLAAEEEEKEFYGGRASESWLKDLEVFETDSNKPFLEIAPWLIVVFRQQYEVDEEDGSRLNNYYVPESVGIACGFLLASLHQAGLATLTHTPSPMNFLADICGRPKNEKATMLIVAGRPAENCTVPQISKKELSDISTWL